MRNGAKIVIVILLAVAAAATFALREGKRAEYVKAPEPPATVTPATGVTPGVATPALDPAVPGAATQVSAPAPVQVAVATAEPVPAKPAAVPAPRAVAAAARPRILELGSMRCQACLEMAKVLDALRASQGARLQVDFIDVFEQPEAADRYKILLIPTQIMFNNSGKEIFRHQGFLSHDDILAKFRALGVDLQPADPEL